MTMTMTMYAEMLIGRGWLQGINFHDVCDEEPQGLQDALLSFCNAYGKPRLAFVKATGPAADSSGFLYIDLLRLNGFEPRVSTELATPPVNI